MQAATPASGAATPPSPRRRGPRPRHSREDVVRAAVAIADSDGLDAVTFRAVAARLGTGVMSLYNYVPDKQALVYEMVELVGAEVAVPAPTGDWRADMHVVAGMQRDLAHRHPWLIRPCRTCSRSAPPRCQSSSSRSAPLSPRGSRPETGLRRSP